MIIGYDFYGPDNDSYMHDNYRKCFSCGARLDYNINPNFKLKIKKYDISYTYDGYLIVSKMFKNVCIENNIEGIEFIDLPGEPEFFHIKSNKILQFDYEKRKTRFLNKCNTCGIYEAVAGVTPIYLKNVNDKLSIGFYRTDIEFGDKTCFSPQLIIDISTYKLLKKHKFRGFDCSKIEI